MVWAELINTEPYFLHRERESFTMNEPKMYYYKYVIARVTLGEMRKHERYNNVTITSSQDGETVIIKGANNTLYTGPSIEGTTVALQSKSPFLIRET